MKINNSNITNKTNNMDKELGELFAKHDIGYICHTESCESLYIRLKEIIKEYADQKAIALLKWMKENGVDISFDEKGEYFLDIGTKNYTPEQLYVLFKNPNT